MNQENTAKINEVKLHAGGRWLTIYIQNAGVSSETHYHPKHNITSAEVKIENMTKEAIRELRDRLMVICEGWPVSSGMDEDFKNEL